jgi:hypothetical protein
MEAELLKTVGQIAGIGGLALGVFLLLFRDIIRKQIFPQLAKRDAYRLLQLIAILVFLIAAIGLAVYVCTCSRNRPAFSSIRPPALQP